MKINKRARDYRRDYKEEERLAGGYGPYPATQNSEELLRRSVMACLLWEGTFYEDGTTNVENISRLIPLVDANTVADIALEARVDQKLRHVPLFIAREMARHDSHKHLVGNLLPKIIKRADEITEFMAIYWKEGRKPISSQVKKGLASAFNNFDEYQFSKYNRKTDIKIKDVMYLVHPKPIQGKEELFQKIADDTLRNPDTWESASAAGENKFEMWSRLIETKKLGALAFLRNLRNMEESGVPKETILKGFKNVNPRWLLPLNYFAAASAAPYWVREIEDLMLRGLSQSPKLKGHTILVVDTSGSMTWNISDRSSFSRLDAAAAMAIILAETCEHISIYITAGDDRDRVHSTKKLIPVRGFALAERIKSASNRDSIGWGGIFTRQCLDYIRSQESGTPDRIAVFSDSQDCDRDSSKLPNPFGRKNYIIDVSSHSRGINYEGIWDAEIMGWSEYFVNYIMAFEGLSNPNCLGD